MRIAVDQVIMSQMEAVEVEKDKKCNEKNVIIITFEVFEL